MEGRIQTVHDDIDVLGDKSDSLEDKNTKLTAELKRRLTHFRIIVEGRTCDFFHNIRGVGGGGGGGGGGKGTHQTRHGTTVKQLYRT